MKNRKSAVLVLVAAALLLTATIGGTIAWLQVQTAPVENTFLPSRVDCQVVESFNGTTKSVQVKNTGNIPAYIRVTVAGGWANEAGDIVEPWGREALEIDETVWESEAGSWVYMYPVAAGENTPQMFSYTPSTTGKEGLHLVLDVVAQAVQAQPPKAVQESWNFVVVDAQTGKIAPGE